MKKLNRKFRLYRQTIGLKATFSVLGSWLRGDVQLREVALPGWQHPVGLRLPTSDIQVVKQVFKTEEYEFETHQDPKVIVDAGANIGLAAIWFTHRFPDAKIIAVEPERGNFELLKHNVAPYSNITAVQAALWDKEGSIEVRDVGVGNWGFMTGNQDAPDSTLSGTTVSEVEAVTVQTLMQRYNLAHIDLLKMDIEGAELEVFQTSAAWLDKVGAMIVELHEGMKPGCTESFREGSRGFDAEWMQGENVYLTRDGVLVPPNRTFSHSRALPA